MWEISNNPAEDLTDSCSLINPENDISEVLLIVNASRYDLDFQWIKNNLNKNEISITNFKKDKVLLALQGKNSFDLFEEWIESSISYIPNFGCEYKIFEHISPKEKIFFSKTGYTGAVSYTHLTLPTNTPV